MIPLFQICNYYILFSFAKIDTFYRNANKSRFISYFFLLNTLISVGMIIFALSLSINLEEYEIWFCKSSGCYPCSKGGRL